MRPSYGPNRCNECFGPVANPVNDEPVHKVNTTPSDTKIAETNPTALKVVEAAQKYAQALEARTVITEQVKETKELLKALEKKLEETNAIADSAQDELRNATTKTEKKTSPT
jgi:uncharacterized protein (DUF2252 family)